MLLVSPLVLNTIYSRSILCSISFFFKVLVMEILARNLIVYPKTIPQLPLQLDVACDDQVLTGVKGNVYNFQAQLTPPSFLPNG